MKKEISSSIRRRDARQKTGGYTRYIADMEFSGMLYAKFVRSTEARGRIKRVEVPELPEGYYYFDGKDIPPGGKNRIEMIKDDWPVFADKEVRFYGEALGLLVGPDRAKLLELRDRVKVEYETLAPALTIDEALDLKGGPIHGRDNCYSDYSLRKGDPEGAFEKADRIIEDEISTGYQEHIYMEPQGVVGTWEEGKLTIYFSGQCPFYVRHAVSAALGIEEKDVRVKQAVTGGAFGGKEHYPDVISTAVAVAVNKLHAPVQIIYDRIEDISYTPKRHPSVARFRTALDERGNIIGMEIDSLINAGAYETCSLVVLQRDIFSLNSVYDIPNVKIRGRAVATNHPPSDAYRGFGAPQGLFAAEMHMSHLARRLGRDEVEFKGEYFIKKGGTTVTNGTIHEEVKLPEMIDRITKSSGYAEKAAEYRSKKLQKSGGQSAADRREAYKGIGMSFFMHGSGFTGNGEQAIIRGVVKMKRRSDGGADLRVSSVEMGQGVQTTFCKIAAAVLDLPVEKIVYDNPDTDEVPDSGPTCASRSIAIVGYLVQEAAKKLKERWNEGENVEVSHQYEHPDFLEWDQESLQGDAYPSYGWGANVIEVEVDPVTYEVTTTGIWSVFDVGVAIDERIVEGQAEGGIIQALGYASLEKLETSGGRFLQNTMADYTIPTSMDFPSVNFDLVDNPYEYGPFGAKGAGELVFDGAAPAFADAVQMALDRDIRRIPVSPEYIMEVVENGDD